jgi:hypothetical protein
MGSDSVEHAFAISSVTRLRWKPAGDTNHSNFCACFFCTSVPARDKIWIVVGSRPTTDIVSPLKIPAPRMNSELMPKFMNHSGSPGLNSAPDECAIPTD